MKTAIITISIFAVLIVTLIYLVSVRSGLMPSIIINETEEVLIAPVELTFDQAVVYTCRDESVIAVAYKTADGKVLELSLPNIGPIIMNQSETLKGVLFKNMTGYELIYTEATIKIKKDSETIFADCIPKVSTKVNESEPVPFPETVFIFTNTNWRFTIANSTNGEIVLSPNKPDDFIIKFLDNGRFALSTDCNNVKGLFTTNSTSSLSFTNIQATEIACEGESKEIAFIKLMQAVQTFGFGLTNDYLELHSNGGQTYLQFTRLNF